MHFGEDQMPVATISFNEAYTYGPYYIANNSNTPSFIKSTPYDDIETGHWVGFIRPISSEDAQRFWALPIPNKARYLWEVNLNPVGTGCKGFIGVPKCGSIIGTSLGMNLNNSAVQCITLTYLGELK